MIGIVRIRALRSNSCAWCAHARRPFRGPGLLRIRQTARVFALSAGFALLGFPWASIALSAEQAAPIKLRYAGQKDQVVAYRIEITADRYEATDTLTGVVTYRFNTVTDYAIRVTYTGGLVKTSRTKPSGAFSSFRGPHYSSRMFGPSRSFSPFSRPRFQGLISTTNELTLTPVGEIRSMQGDSQLPYLLGNASLLVFEPLPDQPKPAWSVSLGLSISEESTGRRTPFPSYPFDQEAPTRTTAGSEIETYHVREVDGPLVIVDKTYRLDSPAISEDVSAFEINGTGTWTFNRELGLSESLELTQKLVVQRGNTTTAFPMTITYRRMPEEEYITYQEEQKTKHEEAMKELAERQEREANTPLTESEIQVILKDLRSDNTAEVMSALRKLQAKTPKTNDSRIATAIDALRGHENVFVKQYVQELAEKWPLPEGMPTAAERKRQWSDVSGNFTVEAEFLELDGDSVYLRLSNGEKLKILLSRLSEEDQQAARELAKAPNAIDNPFD